MAIKSILQYPDPRLRTKADTVIVFDDNLKTLVADMFDSMYAADGIGLAATQIAVNLQVVVMDLQDEVGKRVLINPVWAADGDLLSSRQEGCLSVPGYYDQLPRYERVTLRAFDVDGVLYEDRAEGLYALCIQHECDHLHGKVFVDDLSSLRKRRALVAMSKRHKEDRKKNKKN